MPTRRNRISTDIQGAASSLVTKLEPSPGDDGNYRIVRAIGQGGMGRLPADRADGEIDGGWRSSCSVPTATVPDG